jgi:hypothetical protein
MLNVLIFIFLFIGKLKTFIKICKTFKDEACSNISLRTVPMQWLQVF